MVKPFDKDLRIRIVQFVEAGGSCRGAARHFGVSVSTAIRLMHRYRSTGSVEPGQMGGHRRIILSAQREWILARIAEKPDITTRALADELAARGIRVSHVSVWNLLKREAQSHKKNRVCHRAGPA